MTSDLVSHPGREKKPERKAGWMGKCKPQPKKKETMDGEFNQVRIRKAFHLEMAHQLMTAYTKECVATIHGHSYLLELFFEGPVKSEDGMLLDFGFIKRGLTGFIRTWDHSLVLHYKMDPRYLKVLAEFNKRLNLVPFNPTAENLARYFYYRVHNALSRLVFVRLHETKTGYAEYPVH